MARKTIGLDYQHEALGQADRVDDIDARAYLHHLVKSGETLGAMLLSEINIAYYQRLMHDMREAIAQGTFASFRERTRAGWAQGDIAPR